MNHIQKRVALSAKDINIGTEVVNGKLVEGLLKGDQERWQYQSNCISGFYVFTFDLDCIQQKQNLL